MPLARVVVHLPSCHDGKLYAVRYLDQCAGQSEIPPDSISLNLNKKPIAAERGPAFFRELSGRAETPGLERSRHQSVAARSGEDDQPLLAHRDGRQRQPRVEPLGPEVRFREQAAEIRVALRSLGEQNQMAAIGECDFGAGDRLQTE